MMDYDRAAKLTDELLFVQSQLAELLGHARQLARGHREASHTLLRDISEESARLREGSRELVEIWRSARGTATPRHD